MKISKRDFLKIAGVGLAGLAVKPALRAIAQAERPVAAPKSGIFAGKRMGMVIDARKCTTKDGCRDCITACHAAHNVPDIRDPKNPGLVDVRHEVKWIWTEPYRNAFPTAEQRFMDEEIERKPFLVFCNHCDNPPCVRVCPTKATWKREDGIVMVDWHRCIGCRFCLAACPYGSRSFNWFDPRPFIGRQNPEFPTRMKGVAEKCTFCEERLSRGQAPACVEACKEKAMFFGDLNDAKIEARKMLRARFSIRRKPELGTSPQVYYLV